MAPRELVFTGKGDWDEFLFTYELVEMRGKSDEDMALALPAYLAGDAFKYYREEFSKDNAITEEGRSFSFVKIKMTEKYAAKMTIAEATVEAVNLKFEDGDMKKFLEKADELDEMSGFKDDAKYGLLKKAVEGDKELLKFTVLRSAKTYAAVRKACIEYADNPNVFEIAEENKQETKKEKQDDIEELRRELANMKIMLTKQQRTLERPNNRYNNQLNGKEPLICTYCRKFGHTESSCYTKQRDEVNKARAEARKAQQVTILKKDEEKKEEPIMLVDHSEDEMVLTKRLASGEPLQKQVRFDGDGDEPMVQPSGSSSRRRPNFTQKENTPSKMRKSKAKTPKSKPIAQVLGKRVEQYDLLSSLAQASSGITFGQIARGDVDSVRRDLQKIFSGKVRKSAVHVTKDEDGKTDDPSPPNRHQLVSVTVYSEPVYALLDSGAIPNVMSMKFAKKLNLEVTPTNRRIVVANGASDGCEGVVSNVPVAFGSIVMRLKFLVIENMPFDIIIGDPTQIQMKAKIDKYHATVKLKLNGVTETLNLEYEPEFGDNSEDDFTSETDSETDIGEISDDEDPEALLLMVNDEKEKGTVVTEERDLVDQKLSHLEENFAEKIRDLFAEYGDIIANSFDHIRPSKVETKHKFELTTDEPIFQKNRRAPPAYNLVIRKEIDRMLEAGIITPVESSWTSPVVIVTKKDGNPRFCIDYRRLNAVMKRDRWPMPRVDEIFDEISGSKIFTTIDLFQGYWQIKMEESCKKKTTFICRYGTYQFEVMPMGLMNSAATFQRMMDKILANVDNVRCYIDDVVIHSKTKEEHVTHLKTVFDLLRKNGLRLRLKKCFFMQPRVELLGHYVDADGVHVDHAKVGKIRNAIAPRDRKSLRSFLGLASYYRRFIKGFAKIAQPLSEKTSENAQYEWTDRMQAAFERLKDALTTAPVLVYPDYSKQFIVSTDASSIAVGAVLSQKDDNGREHPIHYASRSLNSAEKNYSAFERETLGVVFALKKFRHYLIAQKFTLFTDHEALKYALNMKDPHGRIARWMSLFAEFDFDIQYKPGEKNGNADYLSRPLEEPSLLVIATGMDDELSGVMEYLTTGNVSGNSPSYRRAVKIKAKNFLVHKHELFRRTIKGLRYVPKKESRMGIMRGLHDEVGHWDFGTTYRMISDRFWWPSMRKEVAHFVRSCDICQKTNAPEQGRPYGKMPVSGLFHTWSIDFAGPLPVTSTGSKYILIAVEHLSGWPVAQSLSSDLFNSIGVLQFVEKEIVATFGYPTTIISDNDTKFQSAPVKDYAKKGNVDWKYVSAYNPRGNAKVERMVGTLKRSISKIALATNLEWDLCIDLFLGGYRRRPGHDGKSPFEVMFGVKPRFAGEVTIMERLASNRSMVRSYEVASVKAARAARIVPASSPSEPAFQIGDMVLMRRGKVSGPKLLRKMWSGPFVIKSVSHPTYTLRSATDKVTRYPVHVRRLRRYVQREYGPSDAFGLCWFRDSRVSSFTY